MRSVAILLVLAAFFLCAGAWQPRAIAAPQLCTERQLLDAAVPNTFPGVPTRLLAGMDGAGNVIAAWGYQFSDPGELYTARYDVATGWGSKIPLDTGPEMDRVFLPTLDVNSSGAALLAWSGHAGIYAAAYVPGDGWQPTVPVLSGPSPFLNFANQPMVRIDAAGNGLLVWANDNGNALYSSRYTAGSGWGTPQVIGDRGFAASRMWLAMNADGKAVLVWEHWNFSQWTLNASLFVPGAEWQPKAILQTSTLSHNPHVALSGDGSAMAVWVDQATAFPETTLHAARLIPGQDWQSLQPVSDTSRPADPWVDTDAARNAVVIWRTSFDHTVSANRYVNGVGWQGTEILKHYPLGGDPLNPVVRMDGAGNALALWTGPDVPTRLGARRFRPATGWQEIDFPGEPMLGAIGAGDLALRADARGVALHTDAYEVFDGEFFVSGTDLHASRFSLLCDTAWKRDFNADGRSDILWRNSATGENYLYPMDGTAILGTEGYLRTVAEQSWQVAGIGDFDGDGKADVLWRNSSTGQNYVYLMNGKEIAGEGYLRTVADQNWKVVGIGDFDGDGKADVLWRSSSSGENYLYPMDGLSIKGTEGYLRTVASQDWQVAAVADVDGDGNADVVWRNSATGENYLYPMSGTMILGTEGFFRTVADANWKIVGTGDFDGDGNADVLWRNSSSGENYLYPMDGTAILGTEGYVRTVPDPNWQVKGTGDYDGDGKADVLWRHATSGENYLYFMDGTVIKPTEGYTRTVADQNWRVISATPAPSLYSVGGTFSGVGGTVTLQNNGADDLPLSVNGAFAFAMPLANGAAYSVSVLAKPAGQTCGVTDGSGAIAGANVTNVSVSCSACADQDGDGFFAQPGCGTPVDCNDLNFNKKPGQINYFTCTSMTPAQDDYNCDGVVTIQDPNAQVKRCR